MNVLIAGANGFIGTALARTALLRGWRVDALKHRNTANIPVGVRTFDVSSLPAQEYDCLFIAIGSYRSAHIEWVAQLNALQNILSAVACQRVILISSVAVYGAHVGPICTNASFNNISLYGHYKIAQEFLCKNRDNIVIIRPTYVYGRGMNGSSLIPLWIKSARERQVIRVLGTGRRMQDYIHVGDLCSLCLAAATGPAKGVAIAATGCSVSNITLASIIAEFVPGSRIVTEGIDDSPSFEFDITETCATWQWVPNISLKDGILELIDGSCANI